MLGSGVRGAISIPDILIFIIILGGRVEFSYLYGSD